MLTAPRFAPEDFQRLRNEAIDYLSKTLRGGNDEELGKWTLELALYKDQASWQKLMKNGMAKDYSWGVSAKEYVRVYERARQARAVNAA